MLNLNEHMESQIFWRGYYNTDLLKVVADLIRSGDTFLDIGANIGEVSLFAARRVGSKGTVLAVEPEPRLAKRLREHIKMNCFNQITVEQAALGRNDGASVELFGDDPFGDGMPNSGLATLYPTSNRRHSLGSVATASLDALIVQHGIQRLDGLKIDVEGAELSVLEGAESAIRRWHPWIVLEVNQETCRAAGYEAPDLLHLLSAWGYRFELIGRRGTLTPISVTALSPFQNLLCSHQGIC